MINSIEFAIAINTHPGALDPSSMANFSGNLNASPVIQRQLVLMYDDEHKLNDLQL